MIGATVGAIALVGIALVAGHAGRALFRRTRVSDILFLILVGILLGPLFGLFDASLLAPAMPFLAPVGLAIILFEGGLELRWAELRAHGAGALAFCVVSWITAAVAITAAAHLALGLALPLALLFAIAVAPTGIVAVIPLLAQLRVPAKARVWLTIETGIGDLLSAVGVTALATFYLFGGTFGSFGALLAARVLLGAAVGIVGGLACARLLHHVRAGESVGAYALALGALLLAYVAAEVVGGSGFLAALVFGLVVGNADALAKNGVRRLASLTARSREHQSELIFLLRSVYFVYLGLAAGALLAWSSLALAAVFAAAIVAARLVAVGLTHRRGEASAGLLFAVMPRGMAAVVLAAIPATMGVPGSEPFVGAALLTIAGADVATTLAILVHERTRAQQPAETPMPAIP